MKIIEALKQIKFLTAKAEDLQAKIQSQCADMEFDQTQFPDMKGKISEWLQAHGDIVKEIARLKFRLQKTNVLTMLSININGNEVTKPIYEWIQRRKTLCAMELKAWEKCSDRNLKDGQFQQTNGTIGVLKMRRYYDPVEKERRISALKSEPVMIDCALEITNCTTDLME